MSLDVSKLTIDCHEAPAIAERLFSVKGEATPLNGERDLNFKLETAEKTFLLKISRPDEPEDFIDFQTQLLNHFEIKHSCATFEDNDGQQRNARLVEWAEGRLWSSVNPITDSLLLSLGQKAGNLTASLQTFEHPYAERELEWDIANALWCEKHIDLFSTEQKAFISPFIHSFKVLQPAYAAFRKGIVHNDVNDNNIIVSEDLREPLVTSIIDFGDAVHTQIINDLAITLAYAIMGKNDALAAAGKVVKGYHESFNLQEEEISALHTLVAMRLLITVTKAALNKEAEPGNAYHQISKRAAWNALEQWSKVNAEFATYYFRNSCGLDAHPNLDQFKSFCKEHSSTLQTLIPTIPYDSIEQIDMSVGSKWLGHEFEYTDKTLSRYKYAKLFAQQPNTLFAGGYLEYRPFYSTAAYKSEGNNGPEYRSVHLGIDLCIKEETPIHAFADGIVFSVHDNNIDKDYGPTVILQHELENGEHFYSLYGHLSLSCIENLSNGDNVRKGDLIGHIGDESVNGGWIPHLHFQLMLSMFDETTNYPGVATPNLVPVWQDICPDPAFVFSDLKPSAQLPIEKHLLEYRKKHLGKSLSVSYDKPLTILMGSDVYLFDHTGQKYLDTINNVAHVGHEHPRVVQSGRTQMSILNTNTRYMHPTINELTKELLATFPDELSVVHFVNSGSEANELAMRMCKEATNQKDMIAIEVGYHGNTQGCVDVSSYKFDGNGGHGAPEHTHIVPLPDSFRGIYRGKEESYRYAEHIDKQILNIKAKGKNVAGFICESIMSCGGQIELPEHYLQSAYESVRKEGGLCIADEVQTGLGRVGKNFWGFQLHGVVPDIVTIGKPFGNGHPLGAVICTQEVADAFANGMEYFNTFGGNPVSCAIGLEMLKVIKDEGLQENARDVGEYFKKELRKLSNEFNIIQDVRGQGLFLGFELVALDLEPLPQQASYLVNQMKKLGILMSTDGRDANVIKIKPPMTFSTEHVDEYTLRLRSVLKEDFLQLT